MVNCPQCQAPNQQNSTYCAACGAQLATAEAPAAAGGYMPPGQSAPVGYGSSSGYGSPAGYGAPAGYGPAGTAAPTGQYAPMGGYPPPSQQQPPIGGYQPGGQPQSHRGGTTPAFQFDLKRLTRSDQVVGIASFIVLISIFLPWFSVSVRDFGSATGSGTAAHGWLWLVFILDLVIIAYLVMRAGWEESPVRIPLSHERLLMAATGLQLLLILIAFFDMPSSDGIAGVSVGWAWGAFIGLLAALAAAAPMVPAVRSRVAFLR
jgi:hypothetical protein